MIVASFGEVARQRGEYGNLAGRGQEQHGRRRRAFEHIGRPQVKRHQRQLEAQTHQQHRAADQQIGGIGRQLRGGRAQFGVAERAGLRVDQRQPEQQEGRCARRQHQVFEAGLQRTAFADRKADHAVQRNRQQFHADEQRCQVFGADHDQAAHRRDHQQQVELLGVAPVAFEIGVRQRRRGQRGDQDQGHVETGVAVHAQQGRDLLRAELWYEQAGDQREIESGHGDGRGRTMVSTHRNGRHHRQRSGADDQDRQQRQQLRMREAHGAAAPVAATAAPL